MIININEYYNIGHRCNTVLKHLRKPNFVKKGILSKNELHFTNANSQKPLLEIVHTSDDKGHVHFQYLFILQCKHFFYSPVHFITRG